MGARDHHHGRAAECPCGESPLAVAREDDEIDLLRPGEVDDLSRRAWRTLKQDKTVSVNELTMKLRPIVEGLKIEGKKNMATMVPAEVAMLAARLERLLNEWAE